MPRRKLHYKEGDWIAIPLVKRGGWGLGLIARFKAPAIIGYFFGPRRPEPPTMDPTLGLRPQDAILVGNVGDLGLLNQEWLVVGSQPNWDRRDWPMPKFWGEEGVRLYICTYDEDAPDRLLHRERATREQIAGLPEDVASGYGALSIKLDNAIAKQEMHTAA